MKKTAFFIGLLFFLIGLVTLPHYAQNWDESLHFYRGQAFLHFILTGKTNYQDLKPATQYYQKDDSLFFDPLDKKKSEINRRSKYMDNGIDFTFFIKGYGHPPFSDIMSSISNMVLFQQLGIINDVDSYHVYCLLLSSVLIGVVFWWVGKRYGIFAGLIASTSLALYPLFLGESHFNIKDPPEAVFYTLAAISFYEGIIRKKNNWIILSSLFFGCGLGTKFNILFLPFSLLPWLIFLIYTGKEKIKNYFKLIPSAMLYPVISVVILYVFYPTLWFSPIGQLSKIINYYQAIGTDASFDSRFITYFGLNTYAIKWIIYSTPIVILLFCFFGILYAFIKGIREKDKTAIFILLLLIIPVARVTRPNAGIYGGVRQIMEYIPAMAMLSGIGANYLVNILHNFILKLKKMNILYARSLIILQVLAIFAFIPITIKLISIHPNESIYFNSLIGGLKGAKGKDLPGWGDSLGNPYRQAVHWLNKNAEKGARVALNFGLGSNIPDILWREDIRPSNTFRSALGRQGEYVIGLTHDTGYENSYFFQYLDKFLVPVYEVKIDGVPILRIWKNDIEHTKKEYRNIVLTTDQPIVNSNSNKSIVIDIGKVDKLAEMTMKFEGNCEKEQSDQGSLEISSDNKNWILMDGDLKGQLLFTMSTYQGENGFRYYFAGNPSRYIKVNFTKDNSCFEHIGNIEIYSVKM